MVNYCVTTCTYAPPTYKDMEKRYNQRSPAVRRLMREAIELREPTPLYSAQPLEDNLFEWHFTIRGPPGTDFDGGVYHGRIILPPEYPMKPPSIVLLTPNGRFELNQKICLSASSYHPELWQASWGIRTMMLALIGFMPTDGIGAIGSLDCSPEARQNLARRSLDWVCPTCGIANRTALPANVENGKDEEVEKEMEDIVSQMSIKSEEQVDSEYKQLISNKKSPPPVTPSQETVSHDTSRDSTTPPTLSQAEGVRQRVQEVIPPQEAVSPTTKIQHSVTNSNQSSSSNVFVLLVIFLLLVSIVGLIVRRIF